MCAIVGQQAPASRSVARPAARSDGSVKTLAVLSCRLNRRERSASITIGNSRPLDLWMLMMRTAFSRAASAAGGRMPRSFICASCVRKEKSVQLSFLPAAMARSRSAARFFARWTPSGRAEKTSSRSVLSKIASINSGSGRSSKRERISSSHVRKRVSFSGFGSMARSAP